MNNHGKGQKAANQARANVSQVRERDLYQKKISAYEREYKNNTSAISLRQKRLRESLLAYSERLQATNRRGDADLHTPGTDKDNGLMVRAKPLRKNRHREKRQILTLQELLNKGPNSKLEPIERDLGQQRFSAQEQQQNDIVVENVDHHQNRDSVKLSLVNASDLNEVLYCKTSSQKSPQQHKPTERQEIRPLPQKLPPLQGQAIHQQGISDNSSRDVIVVISADETDATERGKSDHNTNTFMSLNSIRKRRLISTNLRQKRMKLPSAKLDLIPEVDLQEEFEEDGKFGAKIDYTIGESYEKVRRIPRDIFVESNASIVTGAPVFPVKSARRKRCNDSMVGHEVENLVPSKKSYHGENVINGRSNIQLKPLDYNVSQTKHSKTSKKKSDQRQRRLVFLRDSPTWA